MQPMPDMALLLKIAQSPAGQKLLSMLQASNGDALEGISAAAASGNLEEAKEKLRKVLSSQDAQNLLQQLEKQL